METIGISLSFPCVFYTLLLCSGAAERYWNANRMLKAKASEISIIQNSGGPERCYCVCVCVCV